MSPSDETQSGNAAIAHRSPLDGMECYGPGVRGKCAICGGTVETRCPDGNERCDGSDLLHGDWCARAIFHDARCGRLIEFPISEVKRVS